MHWLELASQLPFCSTSYLLPRVHLRWTRGRAPWHGGSWASPPNPEEAPQAQMRCWALEAYWFPLRMPRRVRGGTHAEERNRKPERPGLGLDQLSLRGKSAAQTEPTRVSVSTRQLLSTRRPALCPEASDPSGGSGWQGQSSMAN